MKIKKGQKLPLYGVGPMIVFGMGVVTTIGIMARDHAAHREVKS